MASKLLNIMTMMLKEIETRLQSASGSHERSYRVTQGRVESLAAEIERERKERRLERPAAMTEGALELAHGMRNLVGSRTCRPPKHTSRVSHGWDNTPQGASRRTRHFHRCRRYGAGP